MVSTLSLIVSGVATFVALVMYLIERTRRQATPSWQPERNRKEVQKESDPMYAAVRDRGTIHVVGEGILEAPVLDVLHGTLTSGTGTFPNAFTFRDGKISYRFIASREAVDAKLEPTVALYWWRPGIFRRELTGNRIHTISLRYEVLSRSFLRPWRRVWKATGKKPINLRKYTELPTARFGLW